MEGNINKQRKRIFNRKIIFLKKGAWHYFAYKVLEQANDKSVVNNHLSLMFILCVSTYNRLSSGRYIQKHKNTANYVQDTSLNSYKNI
jgi:hypothetical protein